MAELDQILSECDSDDPEGWERLYRYCERRNFRGAFFSFVKQRYRECFNLMGPSERKLALSPLLIGSGQNLQARGYRIEALRTEDKVTHIYRDRYLSIPWKSFCGIEVRSRFPLELDPFIHPPCLECIEILQETKKFDVTDLLRIRTIILSGPNI